MIMMEYKIYQTDDEIIVYFNDEVFLNIKSKIRGRFYPVYSFYKNDVLILISSVIPTPFRIFTGIRFQNLGVQISWKRKWFKKYLFINGDYYRCNWHPFSTNCSTITRNDEKIAELYYTRKWFSRLLKSLTTPENYRLEVYKEDNSISFFSLICLLIEFPVMNRS